MAREQIVIGVLVALLCAVGLIKARWFLSETQKGRRLERRFGQQRALWILRAIFGGGLLFGVLLAANVIRPVQW